MIYEELTESIRTLPELSGWRIWQDRLHDDQGRASNQLVVKHQGGAVDGHNGRVNFDLVAAGRDQDSSIPRDTLNAIQRHLLLNFNFGSIVNIEIVSAPRPTGELSNNRPVYTMTIRVTTEQTESF